MVVDFVRSLIFSTISRLVISLKIFWAFCQVLFSSAVRAIQRNATLKEIPSTELSLPLLAARLADLPYQVESADAVKQSIATLLFDSSTQQVGTLGGA